MFIFYDLIFLSLIIIYLPIYLFRRKSYHGFTSRLGILPRKLELDRPIWIHAVSVGEVMAIRQLVEELRKANPGKKIVISTVTPTGNKIAKNIAKPSDFVTYLPWDLGFIVKSVIDKINPALFVIVETEIWPNLTSYFYRKSVPIILVNGRISDRSFKGYLSIKFFLRPILNKISLFCVQTERDRQRLIDLGVLPEKIQVSGNMKFDTASFKMENFDLDRYRQNLNLRPSDRLFVCGSTHPGEEKIILDIYKELQIDFSSLKLLIAPRHPERAPEVVNLVKKNGYFPIRTSISNQQAERKSNNQPVFILDTVGELIRYYAIAEIVFIGGSLIKKGGQNILEPACLGKPVLFGPYMFNFSDIAELFLANQGAILVHDQRELKVKIEEFLADPGYAQAMGKKAKELILKNIGSTEKTLGLIRGFLQR